MSEYHLLSTPSGRTPTFIHRANSACKAGCRRVVVIDPEDAEQVERLRDILLESVGLLGIEGIAAALREFARPTPPRPEEPTGLGAVVEDEDGYRWVYQGGPQPSEGHVWYSPDLNGTALYSEVTAVRVLSEGVQA